MINRESYPPLNGITICLFFIDVMHLISALLSELSHSIFVEYFNSCSLTRYV